MNGPSPLLGNCLCGKMLDFYSQTHWLCFKSQVSCPGALKACLVCSWSLRPFHNSLDHFFVWFADLPDLWAAFSCLAFRSFFTVLVFIRSEGIVSPTRFSYYRLNFLDQTRFWGDSDSYGPIKHKTFSNHDFPLQDLITDGKKITFRDRRGDIIIGAFIWGYRISALCFC